MATFDAACNLTLMERDNSDVAIGNISAVVIPMMPSGLDEGKHAVVLPRVSIMLIVQRSNRSHTRKHAYITSYFLAATRGAICPSLCQGGNSIDKNLA